MQLLTQMMTCGKKPELGMEKDILKRMLVKSDGFLVEFETIILARN